MLRFTDMLSRETPTLFGVTLKPLTLGHVLHMQRENCLFLSPFIVQLSNGTPAQDFEALQVLFRELLVAIAICSRSYEEYFDFKADGESCMEFFAQWKEFFRKEYSGFSEFENAELTGKLIKRKKKDKREPLNILEAVTQWNKYLETGYYKPSITLKGKMGEQSGSSEDWCLGVIKSVATNFNMTEAAILDRPLNVTLRYYYKVGEDNGSLTLDTEEKAQLKELMTQGATA